MDEKPKNIWKKSWKGWSGFFLFNLIIGGALFLIVLSIGLLAGTKDFAFPFAVVFGLIGFLIASFVSFIRWLCCWRNFKRFLFGLACFVTLIALFYAEEDWRGWHAWNKFKHEWEAKGEKFDRASVIPPAVPNDQNFALTPIVFTSYGQLLTRDGKAIPWKDRDTNFVDRLKMNVLRDNDTYREKAINPTNGYWAKGTITDLKGWQAYYHAPVETNQNSTITNEFPVAPQPQTPAQDVLLALSKYDSTIEDLRQASQLPYSRFPLEWDKDDPASILLPHLADLKRSSQVLQLRAIAELQNGESEKALADVKLSLRLADSVRAEPFLISHLVRIAMLQITLQPIYEGLAENKWSEAQLADLDSELAKLDFLADYKTAMRGEMVFLQTGDIEYLRLHPKLLLIMSGERVDNNGDSIPPLMIVVGKFHLIPGGWFYQNELRCVRTMEQFYLPLADINHQTISPEMTRRAVATVKANARHRNAYNFLECLFVPSLGNAVQKFGYAQSSVNLARVANALERYRLAHGEFPDSLDALAAQFPDGIPHDVIGGQPLHYRRTDDGQFVLYSVGWNERDDGGIVGLFKSGGADINKGDWVWRYPQK